MPRVARVKYNNEALYHIIERGNERKDIFNDDADRFRETRKQTQMTLKEIGILFGGLSESMVSKILKED